MSSGLRRAVAVGLAAGMLLVGPAGWAQAPAPRVWLGPIDAGDAAGAGLMARTLDEGVRRDLGRRTTVQLSDQGQVGSVRAGEADPRVAQAEILRVAAKQAYAAGDFEGALEQLRAALELYEAGMASVGKIEAVLETLGYLGAASVAAGYDADGEDFFRRVVAAAPDAAPLDEYSAAAKAVFVEEQRKLLKKKRGGLRVTTDPPGAVVRVDGIEVGKAPVTVPKLVRGEHYVQVEHPDAGLAATRVRVKGGRTIEVALTPALELGPPPAEDASAAEKAALVAMTRAGTVGAPFREMAAAVAGKARADYVVVSHLSPRGNGFVLDAFLYGVEEGQVAAFDEFVFRADLNSAAVQASKFAGAIDAAVNDFPRDKVVVGGQVAVRAPAPPPVAPPPIEEPPPPPEDAPIERAPVRNSKPVPLAPVEAAAVEEDDDDTLVWPWIAAGVVVAGGAVAAAVLLAGDDEPSNRFDAEVRW